MVKVLTWIVIGIVALVVLVGVGSLIYGIGTMNSMVSMETQIEAADKDMQNVHASIFNDIKSQGLTVEKYGDMVLKSIDAAMSGRYGEGGSKAAFQWIQEQNPTMDARLFDKLQAVIEASYNKFEDAQRSKIDIIRVYKNTLRKFPSSIVASICGFPKIDLAKYERMITTEETEKTWDSKKMKTIDPFAK